MRWRGENVNEMQPQTSSSCPYPEAHDATSLQAVVPAQAGTQYSSALCSIAAALENWVARSSRAMTTCVWMLADRLTALIQPSRRRLWS
jgi:hypothetical protein